MCPTLSCNVSIDLGHLIVWQPQLLSKNQLESPSSHLATSLHISLRCYPCAYVLISFHTLIYHVNHVFPRNNLHFLRVMLRLSALGTLFYCFYFTFTLHIVQLFWICHMIIWSHHNYMWLDDLPTLWLLWSFLQIFGIILCGWIIMIRNTVYIIKHESSSCCRSAAQHVFANHFVICDLLHLSSLNIEEKNRTPHSSKLLENIGNSITCFFRNPFNRTWVFSPEFIESFIFLLFLNF